MRALRRRTAALTTAALITAGFAVSSEVRHATAPTAASGPAAAPAADRPDHERYRASCRTQIHGSHAVAYCHNPYPETDRVSLHVECARWWDIDADSAPVTIGAAGYVQLTDRCWKEIRSAWVSHEPVGPGKPGKTGKPRKAGKPDKPVRHAHADS
ncbi:hypothetical protein [Streptomyces sp. AcH 505]|uniref:hypothetical protein n=1 Tax=Streptomyces sp. AcH 505 TaxID=352211 RepID=UPI000B1ED47F